MLTISDPNTGEAPGAVLNLIRCCTWPCRTIGPVVIRPSSEADLPR